MLSKTATMLLGLINSEPLNAYELIKQLQLMNVKNWYEIADSTVYAAIKTLEKKAYIIGKVQKDGNMPDKTVYSITESGYTELKNTLKLYIEHFEYDFVPFMIAAFFIKVFDKDSAIDILSKRLEYLKNFYIGISEQIEMLKLQKMPPYVICNVNHNALLIKAEIEAIQEHITDEPENTKSGAMMIVVSAISGVIGFAVLLLSVFQSRPENEDLFALVLIAIAVYGLFAYLYRHFLSRLKNGKWKYTGKRLFIYDLSVPDNLCPIFLWRPCNLQAFDY